MRLCLEPCLFCCSGFLVERRLHAYLMFHHFTVQTRVEDESDISQFLDAIWRNVRLVLLFEELELPSLALDPNREGWVLRELGWDIAMSVPLLELDKFIVS